MIQAAQLIALFRLALSEKWGYIYGTAGILWTQEKQNAAQDDMAKQYGAQWIGRMVADCSGLFVWAFRQLGASIYHGSNTIWCEHLSAKGTLIQGQRDDGQPLRPGTAVFLLRNGNDRHHIGLYVGNGKCIEAKGTRYGVVESDISQWDEWGELIAVDYDNSPQDAHEEQAALYQAMVIAENGSTVRLRPQPSTKQDAICSVPVGSIVDVLEELDGWKKIRYSGKTGYMMQDFLKEYAASPAVLVEGINVPNNAQADVPEKDDGDMAGQIALSIEDFQALRAAEAIFRQALAKYEKK